MKTRKIICKISQRVNILIYKELVKLKTNNPIEKWMNYMNRNGTEKKKCRWTTELSEYAQLCSQ